MAENSKRSVNPLAVVLILSGVFFAFLLAVSSVLFLSRSSKEWTTGDKGKSMASLLKKDEYVGLVEVTGPIMDSKKVVRRLKKLEEDDSIKAVVVRIDSPGGAVGPSQEMYEMVKHVGKKKPVVASMGSVAASGGFYVAMGAQKVFSNPGTLTGSIGVIMSMINLEKLYEWAKVKRFSIKTGKFKEVGADYREMTDEERNLLQTLVDDVLVQFKQAVAEGRNLTMDAVNLIADGRILSGTQAHKLKLIDTLGTLQDAIQEAATLGKIEGEPRVLYREKTRNRLKDLLMDDEEEDEYRYQGGLLNRLRGWIFGMDSSPRGMASIPELPPGLYLLWTGE